MTEIICPLCGKPNPPDLDECQFCQAPLKTGGFIAPAEDGENVDKLFPLSGGQESPKAPEPAPTEVPKVEQSIPDWLKETEANFLDQSEPESTELKPEEPDQDRISEQIDSFFKEPVPSESKKEDAIDDAWLASLLSEAGLNETAQASAPDQVAGEELSEETPSEEEAAAEEAIGDETQSELPELTADEEPPALPAEDKPAWLTDLESSSTIRWEAVMPPSVPAEQSLPEEKPEPEKEPEPPAQPDWLKAGGTEEPPSSPEEPEPQIAPAELPSWLEAIKPTETVAPSAPVEDVSGADLVTAGPLVGLRGVLSPHPSAVRARKPPTYSIKLRVTDEQSARVDMLEELLADEETPAPLPSQPAISTRNVFRIIVVVAMLIPLIWMIVSGGQSAPPPQPGSIPGVVDFTQQLQAIPSDAPVLVAFDYEAGFSGELNLAITNVIRQLMNKNIFLTLVATTPSGPALAESTIESVYSSQQGSSGAYSPYANLGYIPGGTMGLLGLATNPQNILPYSLSNTKINVWANPPLNAITSIKDFYAVIVLTNDPDTARIWIEQVGPTLRGANRPLLFVSSAQAEPLILPYYQSTPAQVQGLITGLAGGVAYAQTTGNYQENGVWDAYAIGVTVSIVIILIGSILGWVVKITPNEKAKGD